MGLVLRSLMFIAICAWGTAHAADDRKLAVEPGKARVALVIGNGAYRDAPLKNPPNDAEDIAATLKSMGFDVISRRNANQREMKAAVREFGQKLRGAETGLFYYAGHGLQVKGVNYLMPVAADIESEADAEDQTVSLDYVLRTMEESGAKFSVSILDACRNNPFARSFRSASRGLASTQAATGMLIAYATAPGSVAADGEGRNGMYTKHLLKNLKEGDSDILKVFQRVRTSVIGETGGKQTPWESTSLVGDFYFRPGQGIQVVSLAPSARTEAHIEDDLWDSIKGNTLPSVFEEYIRQYPNGRYLGQAKVRLSALTGAKLGSSSAQVSGGRDDANRSETSAGSDDSGGPAADYWVKVGEASHGGHAIFLDTASITPVGDNQFGVWSRTAFSEPQKEGFFGSSYVTELRRKIINCNGPSMAHAELVRLDNNSAIVKKEAWAEIQWRFDSLPSGSLDHAVAQSVCLLARLPFSKINSTEGSGDWRQIVQGIDNPSFDMKSLRGKDGVYVVRTRSVVELGNTPTGKPFTKVINNWIARCKTREVAVYGGFFKNRLNQIADSFVVGTGALQYSAARDSGSLTDEVYRLACRPSDVKQTADIK
jgi:hypothetical protein